MHDPLYSYEWKNDSKHQLLSTPIDRLVNNQWNTKMLIVKILNCFLVNIFRDYNQFDESLANFNRVGTNSNFI